jgi:hypothetical protein
MYRINYCDHPFSIIQIKAEASKGKGSTPNAIYFGVDSGNPNAIFP